MRRFALALGVTVAGLLALVQPSPRAQPQIQDETELRGILTSVWGDPRGTDPQADVPRLLVQLTDAAGTTTPLPVSALALEAAGGLRALNGRHVVVTVGRRVVRSSGQEPATEVRAIRLAAPEDTTSALVTAPESLTGPQPRAVILCRFADSIGTTPHPPSYFTGLMGATSPGLNHYWWETSYANIVLDGTQVFGWYNLPNPRSYYVYDQNGDGSPDLDFSRTVADCTGVADADVHFPNFKAIDLNFNQDLDCCAWGGSRMLALDGETRVYGTTWMPPWAQESAVYAHESGHSLGFPHSSGPYNETYDSRWDPMSNPSASCRSQNATYGCVPVHTIMYHKDLDQWIPASRRFDAPPGSETTITIERSAQPGSSGYLFAKIPIGTSTTSFYTVEARRFVGYDTEVPGEAIVIHNVLSTRSDRDAQVVDPDNNGNPNDAGAMWTPGETFFDVASRISVRIDSQSSSGYSVTISRGLLTTLTSVVPNAAPQGQNLDVAVTGQETHFAQGSTAASFGAGITVNTLTVTDATHATASLTIAANALPGARDVTFTTGGEVAIALNAFAVTQGPALALVSPNRGQPGQSYLNVAITGLATHFVQGSTVANFGSGIIVNSTTVTDSTHATALLTIAGNAALGARDVTLTTGGEVAMLVSGFLVRTLPVNTQVYAYVVGRRLSPSQGGSTGLQTVNVINTSTNTIVATVPVGTGCHCVGPDTIAVHPDGTRVYVPNELDNTLSVIDALSNTVVATVPVGTGPAGVGVKPDGTRVYVVNGSGATSVSVIDTVTNTIVSTIPLGVVQARGIAVAPNGSRVYVSTYGSHSVKVIDTASNSVIATIPVGNLPVGLDVTPDGSRLYVPNYASNTVSVIDTATNTVATTIGSQSPNSARITPDGSRAYLVGSTTWVVNTASLGFVANIPAGGSTLEFTPDGARAYLANYSNVTVINTATNAIAGTNIPFNEAVNGRAAAVAMTPGPIRDISLIGSLTFGRVRVGSSSSRIVTISNSGNSALTVNSIAYPAGFTGNWAGGTIAPLASRDLLVTFTPTSAASYGGPITVNSNRTTGTNAIAASGSGTNTTPWGDVDGDGKADLTVFRPSNGTWYALHSATNYMSATAVQWGNGLDKPVPADYDGDGKVDIAVFRPSNGTWYLWYSATGTTAALQWGNGSDVPVPADYNGDGKADIAVFRPSNGTWYLWYSGTVTTAGFQWGNGLDVPVPGDYDGDGLTDIAVFRPSNGTWYLRYSGTGAMAGFQWGNGSDVPVPGDYNGDGKADVAVFRPSNGTWYLWYSGTGATAGFQWGNGSDVPVPGDYNGDGKADVAVFRPANGTWYLWYSGTGTTAGIQWGNGADIPMLKRP